MRTKNIQEDLDESDIVWIPASIIRNASKYLNPGDILVSSANSWNLVGKGCWVPGLKYPASAGGFISILRGNPDTVDLRYLYHWFVSPQTQAKLRSYSNKTTNISNLDHSRTLATEIPLPPLEEQRRIAAILDKGESIEALFTKREKAFRSVEESLFTALHEGDNRGLTGKAYSLSEVFWFQEGPGVRNWQFTTSGVKLLNVGNITIEGKVDLRRSERHVSEDEAFGKYSHFLVDEGDLLMPSSGIPIEGDGLLRTRSAFATSSDLPLCMNTSTIRFKPKKEAASLLFLQGWLQSREFRVQITKLVTGSAQKNFGPSHLKQLTITLPHPSLQDGFEKRLTRIRELRHSLHPSESNLSELMFSLGNLAFKGGASA
jgi:type I restriction enzyme S subunit